MPAGQIISYSATLPQKRTVTDRIIMADPMSIAGINALGLHNESKFAFVNTPGKMYEWLEDAYDARSTTANDSDLASDSTITTLTVADGTKFHVGDVIQIDSEYIWVSAISTNDLTIVRNKAGTQATHAATATIYIRYNSRLEGADASDSPWTEPSTGYNYSNIFHANIEVSRSDALLKQYGIDNVVNREIDKKMDSLMMQLNLMLYHGFRSAGSSSTDRSAGGLGTFITTNPTSASSAALTRTLIENEMQNCFDYGGNPTLALCNSWAQRKINSFYESSVRTERDDKRGGIIINQILSPFGTYVDIVLDRHCPTNYLWLLDPRYIGYITLDDFFYEELGKVGDTAERGYGQVVGEYGLVVAFEKAHSNVNTFSTST